MPSAGQYAINPFIPTTLSDAEALAPSLSGDNQQKKSPAEMTRSGDPLATATGTPVKSRGTVGNILYSQFKKAEKKSILDLMPTATKDPVMNEQAKYLADPREEKVDFALGMFYGPDGKLKTLDTVQRAFGKVSDSNFSMGYPPVAGHPRFLKAVTAFLFGFEKDLDQRVAIVQTVGGTQAVRLAAEYLRMLLADQPNVQAWTSNPCWGNYEALMTAANFDFKLHAYMDNQTRGLDFDGMLRDLRKAPSGSVVILQGCCHNPSGLDLSEAQWGQVISVVKEKDQRVILDMAYQGLGRGMDEDAFALRALTAANLDFFLVVTSRSKNMGMYSERLGELSVVFAKNENSEKYRNNAQCMLENIVRATNSMPPQKVSEAAAHILGDPEELDAWKTEVEGMRQRLLEIRENLYTEMSRLAPELDVSYMKEQAGMFSYDPKLVGRTAALQEQGAIYMLPSGRMSISSASDEKVGEIARKLVEALRITAAIEAAEATETESLAANRDVGLRPEKALNAA